MRKIAPKFCFALTLLTRIPCRGRQQLLDNPERTVPLFPIVGLLLGLILFALDYLFRLIFPPGVAAILLLTSYIFLTGGIHLDGLSDMVDGFSGGKNRSRVIEIMHDPHLGAFAVIALLLTLLLKVWLFLSLPDEIRGLALLIMPVFSRWMMALSICKYPTAPGSRIGYTLVGKAGNNHLLAASYLVLLIIASLIFFGATSAFVLQTAIAFAAAVLMTIGIASYSRKVIDGLTGDVYGTVNELSEVLILLVFTLKHF